jgi:hypothetical protein
MARATATISSVDLRDGNIISSERALHSLIKKLSAIIKEKRQSANPDHLNAEWTKITLVVPLLEGLGWDKSTDIAYQFGPSSQEDHLDLILKCQTPIGIDARTIYESPPQDIGHPGIKNGLRQCEAKKAPYFIWTNGDCWQFFSLALTSAPLHQICLSEIEDDFSMLEQLLIIKKDEFISHPEKFNKALSEKTDLTALPHAWATILRDHLKELLHVFRKGLKNVDVKDEEIVHFLNAFKPEYLPPQPKSRIWFSNPGKWEQLIDSHESHYRLARWFFRTSYYRKLGEYLINENYSAWTKDSTWRHVGLPDRITERKKIDHAVFLFQEWGFIEEVGNEKYCRVEECIPYLKQLLEKSS